MAAWTRTSIRHGTRAAWRAPWRTLGGALLLLACGAGAADPVDDATCERIAAAHAQWLRSCFDVRRDVEIEIDSQLATREDAVVAYRSGEVAIEVLEKEVSEKRLSINGEGDMAIEIPFACDRLTTLDKQTYTLVGPSEPERVTFRYDEGRLTPLRWDFEATERFLFRRYHLVARAIYRDARRRNCAGEGPEVELGKPLPRWDPPPSDPDDRRAGVDGSLAWTSR